MLPVTRRLPSRYRLRSRSSLLALVVPLAVAGAGAAAAAHLHHQIRTVTLSVDGVDHQERTAAGTVAAVLASDSLPISSHDVVAPSPTEPVHDHERIVLRRGRLLTLQIGPRSKHVWTTATSVREALQQLGLDRAGAYVSASRSRSIGLEGTDLAVRLPQHVTLVADGKARGVTTTQPTVTALLANQKVALAPTDKVSAPGRTYPLEGLVVRVTRIRGTQAVEDTVLPRTSREVQDPGMPVGSSTILDAGADGLIQTTYAVTFVDGKQTARTPVGRTVIAFMRQQVTAVGTQQPAAPAPVPVAAPAPAGPTAPFSAAPAPSGTGGLNWAAVANCEPGGNPRAVSPGGDYRGLYQFSLSTWQGVGGSGDPIEASPAEQTQRAEILYARSGAGSWPVCGRYL